MKDMVRYVINPDLRLKNDRNKCIIYKVDKYFHSVDSLTVITSKEAVLLALFDGTRLLSEVAKIFYYIQDKEYDETEGVMEISSIIDSIRVRMREDVLVDSKIQTDFRTYDPEAMVISSDKESPCINDLRLSAPLSVNFNVATTCGFHCKYCYHPLVPVTPYMPLDRFDALVQQLVDTGCESIMLTGGDPCIRPDFIELLKILHLRGLFYNISTKSILSDEQIEEMVQNCGFDRIQLSLDSHVQEIVSKLIGCQDNYISQFEHMVDQLESHNVDVRIKAVLTALNCDVLGEFLNYVYDRLNVRNIQVVQYGRSGSRHKEYLFPTQRQLDSANEAVMTFKGMHQDCIVQGGGFTISFDEPVTDNGKMFEKRSICNAGRFSLTLLPNGEVFVCEQLPYDKRFVLGNLTYQSMQEFWNGPEVERWLAPPDRKIFSDNSPCKDCPENDFNLCHRLYSRCLRFIWETTGMTDDADIRCPKANMKKRRIT